MQKIDLSGKWRVCLMPGVTSALADHFVWSEKPPTEYPEEIDLPGTTSAAGLGDMNPARETGFLTDAHKFEGTAWYTRTFTVPEYDGDAIIHMERTRRTAVWTDGKCEFSGDDTLSAPHRINLGRLEAGEHTLAIRVDNTGYILPGGHLTSQDTQSNWNGITGEISLTLTKADIRLYMVKTDLAERTVRIKARMYPFVPESEQDFEDEADAPDSRYPATVYLPWNREGLTFPVVRGKLDATVPLPEDAALWSPLHPNLHTMTIEYYGEKQDFTFGLREFSTRGRTLLCNGQEIFLRGKHDGLVFPQTGYAPCDADSWRKVFATAKSYGINHYRFHTCCPPEGAFIAADEMGIVLSPELPFWGTVEDEWETHSKKTCDFNNALLNEGWGMLRNYGRHASFVFLSMGNELWGSKEKLNRLIRDCRWMSQDKLYISGANNFQWCPEALDNEDVFVGVRLAGDRLIRGSYAMCDAPQGIVQTTEPESVYSYDRAIVPETVNGADGESGTRSIQYGTGVKEVQVEAAKAFIPEVPVISHEVGQYQFYPDFSEIDKYTGPLKARNFEVFRERLKAAGLYGDHERFFRCAGALAIACYRREIETALRTRELSGFQLLDLQDFPGQGTALVGVLNAFMESKGLIAPEKWRQFCADTVVLGLFDRFVLADGQEVAFRVQVSEKDPEKTHTAVRCELLSCETLLHAADVPVIPTGHRLSEAVPVSLGRVRTDKPLRLTVRLTLEDGTINEYPLWIFPQREITITPEGMEMGGKRVAFVRTPEEAKASPVPAIVIPDGEGKLPAEYASDFWCYPMFRSISESMGKPVPVGTLGLCIAGDDPLLAAFAREEHTTPAWYRLLKTAHCEENACPDPVVQMIDNTERCRRLSLLWREENVLHMTFRLWEDAQDVTVRAFAASLMEAMACS